MTHRFRQHLRTDRPQGDAPLPADDSFVSFCRPSRHEDVAEDDFVAETPVFDRVLPDAARLVPGHRTQVCLPDPYEPNYAYPLIVWLHGTGGSERELPRVMSRISPQNYLGLSLRGPQRVPEMQSAGYRWPARCTDPADLLATLHEIVGVVRREWHVHTERVYLAGMDEGASLALQLLLARPDWFGGAVAIGGTLPRSQRTLHDLDELHGKPVLLGIGARDARNSLLETVQTGRMLHAAGLDVTTRVFDATRELTAEMGREINRWIMDDICAAV